MRTESSRVRARTFRFATLALAVTLVACGGDSTAPQGSDPATETFASSLGVNIASMTKLSDALYVQDQVVGTGATVANGQTLTVIYTGWLTNGTQFDSDVGKQAFQFPLGVHQVISGWDQGLVGMRVGGKRLLVIGSALGYGTGGNVGIPPNATLVFVVQVTAAQ